MAGSFPGTLLEAALSYGGRGIRVTPLHNLIAGKCSCQVFRDRRHMGPCPSAGKHPRFRDFDKKASCHEERIRAWWKQYPQANIGIVGGAESKLWVLDKDPRNGGEDARQALVYRHGQLPYTLTAKTGGGGTHEYWTWPDFAIPAALQLGEEYTGLDVIGEGHIIVAPPSRHRSGNEYAWEPELGPDEITPQPAPPWLLDLIKARIQPVSPPAGVRGGWPPADIGLVLRGCGWMRHCSDHAATLGEPEWYAQLGVAGRCTNGEDLAHELSRPHPGYNAKETSAKLAHAIRDAGPVTCAKVRHSLNGGRFCDACPNAGAIKSPVLLGLPGRGLKPATIGGESAPMGKEAVSAPVSGTEPRFRPLTELGNAERLIDKHGTDLLFCPDQKQWLIWDGKRFNPDRTQEIMGMGKGTVRSIYSEASAIDDQNRREATASWARRSEKAAQLRAMVALAESEPGVPILATYLDSDTWGLNLLNGTLDLRTGVLRPHRREDRNTKLVPVAYSESAKCPRWLEFLAEIFGPHPDLPGFAQRAIGYSLTGSTREECLFLLYGTGRNGKGVFLRVVSALLGDYGTTADFSMLVQRKQETGPRDDIANLQGRRFVSAQESGDGARFAEATTKNLTGADLVRARRLYENSIEFLPVFKLWLASNYKPTVRGSDPAIWSRLKLVPFDVSFEGREDRTLKTGLLDELPGILTWAVEGCLRWQEDGLAFPESVVRATAEYRQDNDILARFHSDRCIIASDLRVAAGALYAEYRRWCEAGGEKFIMTATAFGRRMGEKKFQKEHTDRGSVYLGLAVRGTSQGVLTDSDGFD